MKQLVQTGWMHNRLRMVTAAFLSKLLLIDWRKGEAFFMLHLLDGDYASNNGGWQWAASTGADAAPYFRIFSPERQSQRFDTEGKFIKRLLPELTALDKKSIHTPSSEQRLSCRYIEPIVDYKYARQRALERYAIAMGKR
jgi:deoxyribodipyrimidine photo-lyase